MHTCETSKLFIADTLTGVSTASSIVRVGDFPKMSKVPEREPRLGAAPKGMAGRKRRNVRAVDAISFEIEPGAAGRFLGALPRRPT